MCFSPDTAGRFRDWFHWPFAFAGEGGTYLAIELESAIQPGPLVSPDEAAELLQENERLKREVRTLRTNLKKYSEFIINGNRIFSHLFGPSSKTPVRLIPARVATGDSLPYSQSRLLNPDSSNGIKKGQFVTSRLLLTDRSKQLTGNLLVLGGEALAGRIIESSAYSARLQLVTDRSFKLRAQILRVLDPANPREIQDGDRMRRLTKELNVPIDVMLEGDGTDGLLVRQVDRRFSIRAGDLVMTHPDDPALPAAVAVGKIIDVKEDREFPGRSTVYIQPALLPKQLHNVFIVVPNSAPTGSGWGR